MYFLKEEQVNTMTTASYGTWKSPISSQVTTETGVDLLLLKVDDDPNFSGKIVVSSQMPFLMVVVVMSEMFDNFGC